MHRTNVKLVSGPPEIDATLADRAFFQSYLKNALAHRASIAGVSESPIDTTYFNAIFLLTELADTSIFADLLKTSRYRRVGTFGH